MSSSSSSLAGRIGAALLIALFASSALATGPESPPEGDAAGWPRRVLITNDNGIDDVKLIELARALARRADTWVVAATADRSGTSNLMSGPRSGEFRVERRDLGDDVRAYALDGYPADCVLFALGGPMRDQPPDLVISGINGGANLGDAWFGSGTIGAARTAAYLGIPALAVSGLDDGDPEAVRAAVDWIVELVHSPAVRDLRAPQYLTVSLPTVAPDEVAGVEVVRRARGLLSGSIRPEAREGDGPGRVWRLELELHPEAAPEDSDVAAAGRRSIAIVPMRVDESDDELLDHLRRNLDRLPSWSPPEREGGRRCRSGLGVTIDDAEDPTGREWGVIIEEVLEGGRAEEVGLRPGDVVVALNGTSLAVTRTSPGDPDERFLHLLRQLSCGDAVSLEYVREGETFRVAYRIPDASGP